MKEIVMLQGMGNNERGWARLVSAYGRVVLVQQGMIQHVEIWENGQCAFRGPEVSVIGTRRLDEITFSSLTLSRCVARTREHTRGRAIDLVIAANYSMGGAGLWLRALGKARRTVCFISDYLPPRGSLAVRMHRRTTSLLTRFVARHSDEVWAVSPRIPTAAANPRHYTVPICLSDNQTPPGQRQEIGYIGFPSPDHALDVLFDICARHRLRAHIIGDSPYLQSIKHQAPPGTEFHGVLNDEARINQILARCFCGYAVYRNTGSDSYSYFGVPSKTFYCFASNTPVVTTNTAHFTQNIEKYRVGRVVEPVPDQIEQAVLQLKNHYASYYEAIQSFRAAWNDETERFHRQRLGALLA